MTDVNNSNDLNDSETSYTESSDDLTTSSDEHVEQSDNLDLEGCIIKKYNVIYELGRGANSIVWLVFDIVLNKFFALKVQNPSEYNEGLSEIKFVNKLTTNPPVFNNLIEYFIEKRNGNKYLCSTWNLHCSNIDSIIRKGQYQNGLPINMVKKIMKQLIESVKILHHKYKVFHGDIKSDNILIKGINDKDEFIIRRYQEENFFDKYNQAKKQFWLNKGKNIKNINDMKSEDKLIIRQNIHRQINEKILEEYALTTISKYDINEKYFSDIKVSLADFGTHCDSNDFYEEPFGTRYYQAPEIILMGRCSYPVDIWAIGCTFYELLSGKILFDPIKDSENSRDYYHLCLINQTCGQFSETFLRKTKYYKQFFGHNYKIKNYEYDESDSRLDRKINEIELDESTKLIVKDLLLKMLSIDSAKRITIDELSKHPFFNT